MIPLLFGTIVLAIFLLFFIPKQKKLLIKNIGLISSFFVFLVSIQIWILFDNSTAKLQFRNDLSWLSPININFVFGYDGISIFFLLLTTLLIPICLLTSWKIHYFVKEYFLSF